MLQDSQFFDKPFQNGMPSAFFSEAAENNTYISAEMHIKISQYY